MEEKLPKTSAPQSAESLIQQNAQLIEEMFASKAWIEIALPTLQECIAGVSGRFTNGRYWHGTLTTKWENNTSLFVAGYQKALMDYHNMLHDFIVKRDEIIAKKKVEVTEKSAPVINPFMEDQELED